MLLFTKDQTNKIRNKRTIKLGGLEITQANIILGIDKG